MSAEYGRFAGGVATAVTKSGGNTFSGSFRTSFANDSWRSLTPFQTTQLITTATDALAAQGRQDRADLRGDLRRAGVGRSVVVLRRDALAETGRAAHAPSARTSRIERRNEEQRYEGKLTYTPKTGHSLQGSFFKLNQTLFNSTGQQVADLKSLTPQGQPQSMISTQYTGVLTPNFSLSAQYSARKFALTDVGADKTDRIDGTLVLDLPRNWRFWSPTFCSGSAAATATSSATTRTSS